MAANGRTTAADTINRAHALCADEEQLNELVLIELQVRSERLGEAWEQFQEHHGALIARERNEGNLVRHAELFQQIENHYMVSRIRFQARITALAPAPVAAAPPVANWQANMDPIRVVVRNQQVDNTWGTFDGTITQWRGFRDKFSSAVHNNDQIEPVFKFQHLQASLKGAAKRTLGEWDCTADNYVEAWNRLNDVYNRPYITIMSHLKKLTSLPAMEKASYTALRNLIDRTNDIVRQLNVLGAPTEHWNLFVVFLVQERLDDTIKREWEMNRANENPTLAEITAFLDRQANALLTDRFESDYEKRNKRKHNGQPEHDAKQEMNDGASNQTLRSAVVKQVKKYPCVMCQEDHPLNKCPRFRNLSLQTKKKFVNNRKFCENCLRPQSIHTKYDGKCMYDGCAKCPGKPNHNSLLCPTSEANYRVHQLSKEKSKGGNSKRKSEKEQKNDSE